MVRMLFPNRENDFKTILLDVLFDVEPDTFIPIMKEKNNIRKPKAKPDGTYFRIRKNETTNITLSIFILLIFFKVYKLKLKRQ